MKKYALIVVAIEMVKRNNPGTHRSAYYNPMREKYAFIRYTQMSKEIILIEKVIGDTKDINNVDELEGRTWPVKHDTKCYQFEDDEEAELWYKLQ